MNWHETGRVAPESLTPTRLQLHYGAYILGSVAHSVLEHAADDSHSNLGFDPDHGSLRTRDLADGLTLHLDLVPFELVLRAGAEAVATRPLDGQTLDEALGWVGEALATRAVPAEIARREYPDFPSSPIMTGGAFEKPDENGLAELGTWFGNAREALESLRPNEGAMSEARVWPHHFDLGALIPISSDAAVSIGLGCSPGDEHIDQPYFYCSPYPAPAAGTALPSLPVGSWKTEGFTSAILTAVEIQGSGSQGEAVQRYLAAAVAGCRELLPETTS